MIKTVGYAARTIAKAQTARLPPGGHVYGRESEPTFRAIGAPSAERCGTPAAHCTSRTPTDLLGFIKMTTDRGSVAPPFRCVRWYPRLPRARCTQAWQGPRFNGGLERFY